MENFEDAERFVSSVNAYRFDFEPELFCFNHFAVNKGGFCDWKR